MAKLPDDDLDELAARCQLAFARDALVRLVDAFYSIFKFTVALRQSFGDDIRAARHGKRTFKKYSLADFEFVHGTSVQSQERRRDCDGQAKQMFVLKSQVFIAWT